MAAGQSSQGLRCKQCGRPLSNSPSRAQSLPSSGVSSGLADLFGDDSYDLGANGAQASPLQPVGRLGTLKPAKAGALARPEKSRRKKRRKVSLPSIPPGAIAGVTVVAIVLLIAMVFVAPAAAFMISLLLMFLSPFLCLGGILWTVARAFRDDPTKALMCLLIPFYGLIYTHSTYSENRGPTRMVVTGLGLFVLAFVAAVTSHGGFSRELDQMSRSAPAPNIAYDLSVAAHLPFNDRGAATQLAPGVAVYGIPVGMDGGSVAGFYRSKYWLYLPEGQHSAKSLPCVLITEAGSNLLTGIDTGNLNVPPGHPEHMPYPQAGMAVLAFSLDGALVGNPDHLTYADLLSAHTKFRDSFAGMINARNALEYVLEKVPEVDPSRIFIAGHSSAGTLAILFAQHESRLRGCVAYAPCTDVAARLRPLVGQSSSMPLPGVDHFLMRSSPMSHVSSLKCPVMIFHAQDDSNVPVSESTTFANLAKQSGKHVDLVTVPTGDHYQSMIDQGIPTGLQWFEHITQAAAPAATAPPAQ